MVVVRVGVASFFVVRGIFQTFILLMFVVKVDLTNRISLSVPILKVDFKRLGKVIYEVEGIRQLIE